MRLLSRQTDYAVNALCHTARRRGLVSVADLQDELDMPRAFIRGILMRLAKVGFLHSVRGKRGGFVLAMPASRINVLQVMQVFQAGIMKDHCLFRRQACPRKNRCLLRTRLVTIETLLRGQLRRITIASLLRGPAPGRRNRSQPMAARGGKR